MSAQFKFTLAFLPKVAAAASLLVFLGASSAAAQSTSILAKRGEALVSRECAMCHAVGQSGGGPMRQAPSFAEIARRSDLSALKQSFERGTLSGHPSMPRFTFDPTDIAAILAYLEALKEP